MQTTTIKKQIWKTEKDVWRVKSNKTALDRIINKYVHNNNGCVLFKRTYQHASVAQIQNDLTSIARRVRCLSWQRIATTTNNSIIIIYRSLYVRAYHWSQLWRARKRRAGDEEVNANERRDMSTKHDSFFVVLLMATLRLLTLWPCDSHERTYALL